MKVVQVKCPQCGNSIQMKQKDLLFYCSNCGTIHSRDHGVEKVDYEIADLRNPSPGDRYYMPFWRLQCSFVIRSRDVAGGPVFKLSQWVKGGDNGGNLFIFVPAADVDLPTFRFWAVRLTTNPPGYTLRSDFNNMERLPVAIPKEEAYDLADFVAVTLEAEKPGTLQYLDYTLTVNNAKLVYLPFISSPSGLVLGG